MLCLLTASVCRGRKLTDANNDKFSRFHGSNSDQDNQPPIVDIILSHGGAVAADKEGFFYLCALQGTITPDSGQEVRDALCHSGPERIIVRLEDHPLCASIQRGFNKDEEAAHVDVFPLAITGDTASPPHAQGTVFNTKVSQYIDTFGVKDLLLPFVDFRFQVKDATNSLVSRGFVNATLIVYTGVYPRHMAAGWNRDDISGERISDLHARIVESCIPCVKVTTLILNTLYCKRSGPDSRIWIKDSEAVPK